MYTNEFNTINLKKALGKLYGHIMEIFGPENRSGRICCSFNHYLPHNKRKRKVTYYHVDPPGKTISHPSECTDTGYDILHALRDHSIIAKYNGRAAGKIQERKGGFC